MDVLREYLYVDLDKVKGLASQLYEGIPEATEESNKKVSSGQLGSRSFAFVGAGRESDVMNRKDIVDALFPAMERDLEAEGYLEDISTVLSLAENFDSGVVSKDYPPGSIVRISSPGRLVDPRYFARTMAGFATAANGLHLLNPDQQVQVRPPGKRGAGRPRNTTKSEDLDESIPDIPDNVEISTQTVRGMVKIMRGVYPEGVSMLLNPAGVEGPSISIRLQEGRQHLDAEPETLFARYGLGLQEWTVVGTIGYHAQGPDSSVPIEFTEADNVINRGKLTAFVNNFLEGMSAIGLVQMAQAPGFSVVPIAVYRVVPRSVRNRGSEGPGIT
ncbi:DUF6414 family protein [Nocardia rhamnosiphila]|uniref:DUF6414 family protein n=1 Tax=Nocardia rhamnosiphila TaxID=426716 RepID=UPI0004C3C8AA|nr:hypothetical protein [Nocardia rhamnosiphila]